MFSKAPLASYPCIQLAGHFTEAISNPNPMFAMAYIAVSTPNNIGH